MKYLKVQQLFLILILQALFTINASAQYKSYKLNSKGDTINAITQKGLKQGKWVTRIEEIRGEPGFEEEGIYKNGVKEGIWRKYNLEGDIIAVESYLNGGKDGLQQYFTYLGDIEREESWKGYNPDAPFDTIPVYGTGNNEIVDYKVVKAVQYSVKHGEWRYFDPGSGRLMKKEQWERNNLVLPDAPKKAVTASAETKKKVEKTAEMMEWEKKNKGKKRVVRDGKTGL